MTKETTLLWKQQEHNNGAISSGVGTLASSGGSVGTTTVAMNGGGYSSLRSSSCASTLNIVGSSRTGSGSGSAFLRCCVYRLANVNIRRWILALVLITVLSIVCYTRIIDAPFST